MNRLEGPRQPIRLPVETQRSLSKKEGIAVVEPTFKIGEVSYYDRLPTEPTERPRQTLLPMSEIRDWVNDYIEANPEKGKKVNWEVNKAGLKNSGFGSVEHYATVEYDTEGNLTDYLFDGLLQQDGTLDPRTGIATPGAVVAPIEKVNGEYYVHSFWQWRPAAWNQKIVVPSDLTDPRDIAAFKAANTGMWFLTVPGGFANFVGDTLSQVAKREAMEEAGLRITEPNLTKQSFNRASVASLLGVGFSAFERVGEGIEEEGEKILGKMAVRIDVFRSPDAIVTTAVNHAREELGLIRSGK